MAMLFIKNNSEVDIVDRNVDGRLYTVKAGKTIEVSEAVATELLRVYGFLSVSEAEAPKPLKKGKK